MVDNKEQIYSNDIWESEFHKLNEGKISWDILIFPILIEYIKDILVFLKIKKMIIPVKLTPRFRSKLTPPLIGEKKCEPSVSKNI